MQVLHGAKICPAADILATHTPHLHIVSYFLSLSSEPVTGFGHVELTGY